MGHFQVCVCPGGAQERLLDDKPRTGRSQEGPDSRLFSLIPFQSRPAAAPVVFPAFWVTVSCHCWGAWPSPRTPSGLPGSSLQLTVSPGAFVLICVLSDSRQQPTLLSWFWAWEEALGYDSLLPTPQDQGQPKRQGRMAQKG